ncbi:MAG: DNA polymerase I [Candidatus Actinomarinales bacterium]|nr:MAG: DNA polymerase I [Candidatus Actinomarinales bacterium]
MVILIDGFSIAFRAFYALPETLMTSEGTPTNLIHGFLSMINKVINEYKSEQMIVTWDLPGKTFRNDIYKEYKANRSPAPDNFKVQIPLLYDLLDAFNIPQVSEEGYEADDVLGSLAKNYNEKGQEVLIVTGDRDTFQLITKNTKILYTKRGISEIDIVDEKFFSNKYGFKTDQYIEYLALKGDPSDNIPGLAGVGEKTATSLLIKYKTIDEIYKNLDDLTPKIKNSFEENKETLLTSKELATIRTDLKIKLPKVKLKDTAYFSDKVLEASQDKVKKLELNKYITSKSNSPKKESYENEETDDLIKTEKLTGPQLVINHEDKIYFINSNNYGEYVGKLSKLDYFISLNSQKLINIIEKETNNLEFDAYDCMLFLKDPSIRPDNLLNISKHLDRTTNITNKSEVIDYLIFFQKHFLFITKEVQTFKKQKKLFKIYKDLDFPLLAILDSMNKKGVKVSKGKIDKLSKEINSQLDLFDKEIKKITKKDFNLNSPKQLSEILYVDMKYPVIKKTPKGAPSTDASVLEELSKSHELPKIILKYREYEKLRSTYIEGLKNEIVKHRIHTSYNLFGTTTGRLSSEKPNLQNIPNKTAIGQKIREFFIADNNHSFIIADYSQIELRVLAHLSKDKNMISMLRDREADIHSETAARIFNIDVESVSKDMRRKAKEVNFGLIYGMESFGLSKSLDISKNEANELIDSYFNQFPKIKGYLDNIVKNAESSTFTETLYGRKRFIRELASSNFQLKSMGKRIAMNAPIQGTASDIMKISMIKLEDKITKLNSTNIILQIHDEIIIQTPDDIASKTAKLVQKEMENATILDVPLYVDIKQNKNLANFNN